MLAETAGGRRAVLKSIKSVLGREYFAPYYGFSRKVLRDYNSGKASALSDGINQLKLELRNPGKPQHLARLSNNLRALADYNRNFRRVRLTHTNRKFGGLPIRGIVVTCEPTISGILAGQVRDTPMNVIIEFGEEAPTQEAANYTTELIFRASGATFKTPPDGAQLWHPGSGAQWFLKKSKAKTWRDIEAACEEIAARWPGI
jgi:hypothetical protein